MKTQKAENMSSVFCTTCMTFIILKCLHLYNYRKIQYIFTVSDMCKEILDSFIFGVKSGTPPNIEAMPQVHKETN